MKTTRPWALAAAAAVALATSAAHSQDLKQKDGLMTFPNVRLETAAVPVATGSGTRADAGLRAYRDEHTGQLRHPSLEEIVIEAAEAPRANDPAGAVVTRLPNGSLRAALDDSFLSNFVVQRLDDGSLAMRCVVGDSKSTAWLRQATSTTGDVHHGH